MKEVCKIQGIEPFNEVYYKDCYFNSLFSVMNYFHADISYVLINDIFHYDLLNQGRGLQIRYQEIKDINEILLESSIKVESRGYSDDIIGDIKNAINQDKPVILAVDSFCCPNILDTYQKNHVPHTILINGYDDLQRIFYIIDLEILNNLTYKKFTISYEQLLTAHQADLVVSNQKKGENTIFFYSKTDVRHQLPEVRFIFLENLRSKENELLKGLEDFEEFIHNYDSLSNSDKSHASKELLDCFVQIFNSKKVEHYRFERIFGDKHLLTIGLQQIQDVWKQIMTQYGLYHYSPKKPESLTIQASVLLKEAMVLEKELLSKLLF
jgi:hypothetical protein